MVYSSNYTYCDLPNDHIFLFMTSIYEQVTQLQVQGIKLTHMTGVKIIS